MQRSIQVTPANVGARPQVTVPHAHCINGIVGVSMRGSDALIGLWCAFAQCGGQEWRWPEILPVGAQLLYTQGEWTSFGNRMNEAYEDSANCPLIPTILPLGCACCCCWMMCQSQQEGARRQYRTKVLEEENKRLLLKGLEWSFNTYIKPEFVLRFIPEIREQYERDHPDERQVTREPVPAELEHLISPPVVYSRGLSRPLYPTAIFDANMQAPAGGRVHIGGIRPSPSTPNPARPIVAATITTNSMANSNAVAQPPPPPPPYISSVDPPPHPEGPIAPNFEQADSHGPSETPRLPAYSELSRRSAPTPLPPPHEDMEMDSFRQTASSRMDLASSRGIDLTSARLEVKSTVPSNELGSSTSRLPPPLYPSSSSVASLDDHKESVELSPVIIHHDNPPVAVPRRKSFAADADVTISPRTTSLTRLPPLKISIPHEQSIPELVLPPIVNQSSTTTTTTTATASTGTALSARTSSKPLTPNANTLPLRSMTPRSGLTPHLLRTGTPEPLTARSRLAIGGAFSNARYCTFCGSPQPVGGGPFCCACGLKNPAIT